MPTGYTQWFPRFFFKGYSNTANTIRAFVWELNPWKFQRKWVVPGRERTSLYFRVNLRSKDKLSFRDNNNIYLSWYSSQWYQAAKNVYSFFAKTFRNGTPRKNNDLKSEPERFSPKSTFGLEKKPFYLNPDHSCSRTFSDWDLENLAMK